MNNRILFIGDSFVSNFNEVQNKKYKFEIESYFKNFNLTPILNGDSGRDIQSIIDLWIKSIPKLTFQDYLVIIIPTTKRTRLPINTVNFKSTNKEFNFINYFVGTTSYKEGIGIDLEYWGDSYKTDFFCEKLKYQELINGSNSSQKNFNEIIESLYKITPCKTFIISWDIMTNKSDIIYDKEKFINSFGFWETENDLYKKTNGKSGVKDDGHWSMRMNKFFFYFLKNYFKMEIKKKEFNIE